MKSFLQRFGSVLLTILSGFDRLRFRGVSRLLNNSNGLESYLYQRNLRRNEFARHAEALTDSLVRKTEEIAEAQGVPLKYLDSPKIDKEAAALALAKQHGLTSGRIAVLSCVESCRVYRLRKDADGQFFLRKEDGKCQHYYHYFLHPELGLCYVRLQSWFPFAMHIGTNGRERLFRQLQQRGVPFERRDNLLLKVDDWNLAQHCLDQQLQTDWPALLNGLVEQTNPLWPYLRDQARVPYYWMTEQSEWASDLVFQNASDLERLYPQFLQHGIKVLGCTDVLRFMSRTTRAQGEVKIDLRDRREGVRLKMWHEHNSIKMYDKAAEVLRLETTINQAAPFKVYRTPEGSDPDTPWRWMPMRQGVADLHRRAQVSQRANERFADSLAQVAETKPFGETLKPYSSPVLVDGKRKARPLNLLPGADGDLLRVIAQGDFLLNGFRNRDLRQALHGSTDDKAQERRQSAQITRKLALLRAHGVITKVPKTHRYQVSAEGKRLATALLYAYQADVTKLAHSA